MLVINIKYLFIKLYVFMYIFIFFNSIANALPAFARREKVSCTMCHENGSAPHLNEFGYLYRRMAFHWPGRLGDEKADEEAMEVTRHLAVGVNVGYSYAGNSNGPGTQTVTMNGINVPEVELWPLVGGFFGNWGVWSEIDAAPETNTQGGVAISQADLRYAVGSPEAFINARAGMIAGEGFGASDQWLDDGNIPLMDRLSANYNQDTMVTPWGAMGMPELGFEIGLNYQRSHLTLGLYDGFTDLGGTSPNYQIQAATAKQGDVGMRDFRLQLDQFIGQLGEITAGYYYGAVPMMDPSNSFAWLDHYGQARLYLTAFAIPSRLDLLLGGGWMKNEFVTTVPTPAGTFETKSGFLGANYYVMPHLTVSGRIEQHYFNATNSASGLSVQISMPFENKILNFHYNHTASAFSIGALPVGWSDDIGLILRFLL